MKKHLYTAILTLMGVLALCVSCNKEPGREEAGEYGSLTVRIGDSDRQTKVGGYTTAQPYETAIRSLEILVFRAGATDADSYLELYHLCNAAEMADMKVTLPKVKTGEKYIYVVANGPKNGGDLKAGLVRTIAELKAIPVTLFDNVTSGNTGFVAFGGSAVHEGETTATISLTRLASRIALRKITNSLPAAYTGNITVNRAWIGNVVANQTLDGTAAPATWFNRRSREDKATQVSTDIIDGSAHPATCPSLTFKTLGVDIARGTSWEPATPALFYCYANPVKTDPAGFGTSWSTQRTTLVVELTIPSAGTFYYVLAMPDGLKSESTLGTNKAYTVDLNVMGFGESDPNKPVTKASVAGTVLLSSWSDITPYSESI